MELVGTVSPSLNCVMDRMIVVHLKMNSNVSVINQLVSVLCLVHTGHIYYAYYSQWLDYSVLVNSSSSNKPNISGS